MSTPTIMAVDNCKSFLSRIVTFLNQVSIATIHITTPCDEHRILSAAAAEPALVLCGTSLFYLPDVKATSRLRSLPPASYIVALVNDENHPPGLLARQAGADAVLGKQDVWSGLMPLIKSMLPEYSIDDHNRNDSS